MTRWLVVAVFGCATLEPRRHRPEPTDVDTLLYVTIHADLAAGDCDDAIPRRYEILIDGATVGHADVPCGRALPPGVSIDPHGQVVTTVVTVPPGTHQIGMRDRKTGITAMRTYVFPYYLPHVIPPGEFYERRAAASQLDVTLVRPTEIQVAEPSIYRGPVYHA